MDVRWSAEQVALRDAAARLVADRGPRSVRDLDDAERAAKLDAAISGAGWRDLRSADEAGAPWASAVEAAIVAEELGRGLADTAFIGPTLAAELRRLARLPASESPQTVVLDAGLRGLARSPSPNAVAIDAAGCQTGLLLAGAELAEVSLPPAGGGVDLTRGFVPLHPGHALVPVAPAPSDDDMTRWHALGLALTTADLVGVMRGAVETACAYATARRQYGVAVGSFQAVQHMLADAHVATEGSRSAAVHAAWAVDALAPPDALVAGSVAKAYSARAARKVCETGIQVHGGIGNTWECTAHVYLRRALFSSDVLGGPDACVERVLGHRGIGGDDGLR